MEWNEHKADLKEVLNKVAAEFGEPFVAKCICETITEMEWYYNTANDTFADIAKEAMMKIGPSNVTSEVLQLEGYTNRLMNRIKNRLKQ